MNRRAAPHRGLDLHYGDGDDARPSRAELKRASEALQALGLELAELPAERLAAVAMPDELRAAIDEYRRTKSREGRRRQLQYVGKLMRSADEAALREALAAATLGSARETLALHEAERWRAELIADDAGVGAFVQQFPATDTQQLRSLVRSARKDAALAPEQRSGRAFRELFQFIKQVRDDHE